MATYNQAPLFTGGRPGYEARLSPLAMTTAPLTSVHDLRWGYPEDGGGRNGVPELHSPGGVALLIGTQLGVLSIAAGVPTGVLVDHSLPSPPLLLLGALMQGDEGRMERGLGRAGSNHDELQVLVSFPDTSGKWGRHLCVQGVSTLPKGQ